MSSLSTPGSHDLSRAAVGRSSPPEVTVWRSLAELPIVAKPTLPLGLAPVNLLKAVVVKFTPGGFGSVFATTVSLLDQPASQEVLKDWQATSGEAIEQTKEEARGAMDNYFDFLHKAIASIPTGYVPLFVEHCEAVAAEIDVRRHWLGEQERRVSFCFGELPEQHVTLEVAYEPSVVGSLWPLPA